MPLSVVVSASRGKSIFRAIPKSNYGCLWSLSTPVSVCLCVSVAHTLWHTLQQQIVVKLSEFIAINYAAVEVHEKEPTTSRNGAQALSIKNRNRNKKCRARQREIERDRGRE